MDVSTLYVRDAMLHVIPQASRDRKAEQGPTLSDLPAHLTAGNRAFLEEKIRLSLSKRGRPVIEEEGGNAVSSQIKQHLEADPADHDLVTLSKDLARALYAGQPGISPPGILIVADAEFAGSPALIVAKLDHENGMRALIEENETGQTVVDIEWLANLFITDGTRVFKLAVFSEIDQGALRGALSDEQAGGYQVAGFFLTFLSCRYTERPQELTERFFNAAQEWLNTLPDAEQRTGFEVALLTSMRDQSNELDPVAFASQHLPVDERDGFIDALREHAVPIGVFGKDLELVESRLKRVTIETETGVIVLAPPEQMTNGTVEVDTGADGQSSVTIRDRVRRVGSRGGQ